MKTFNGRLREFAAISLTAVLLQTLTSCSNEQFAPPPPPPMHAAYSPVPSSSNTQKVRTRRSARPAEDVYALSPMAPAPPPPPAHTGWFSFRKASAPANTESYAAVPEIPFRPTKQDPLSTFSIDVDTASYSNVRRLLSSGERVPSGAVRIEELVNYFSYNYPQPGAAQPFSVNTAVASCPWSPGHKLVRIGLHGRDIAKNNRPAANLVFLIDVSGSMGDPAKLPLVQSSLRMLVNELQPRDRIAMVVYAGASGIVLPSTTCSDKARILKAIDNLEAGGSTNGGEGIQLAYATARENFISGGTNRVVLATDGDFNVGITDESSLVKLIQQKAKSGIFLSVLGYGIGNYKDATLEQLADKGNGNYAYIDTLNEARKVLVKQAGASLITIAKDVKIQVEFNPTNVAAYRLLGYENRKLEHQDFSDDTKDAGEIGSGHTVTALYEIIPAGQPVPGAKDIPLKYTSIAAPTAAAASGELLTVKLRYKRPNASSSQLLQQVVHNSDQSFDAADSDFRFATAVTAFGMKLRGSPHAKNISSRQIRSWASGAVGSDSDGYRREFVKLAGRL